MRSVDGGWIENLEIKDGQPVLRQIRVVRHIPVPESAPWACARTEFLATLTDVGDGVVDLIKIKGGRPTDVYIAGTAPVAPPAVWLTVTEAAELLLTDISGIDLARAKARVSKAADAGRFRTNGETGRRRRIERDSLSTWRLKQRDRDDASLN